MSIEKYSKKLEGKEAQPECEAIVAMPYASARYEIKSAENAKNDVNEYNLHVTEPKFKDRLSYESKMVTLAALQAYNAGVAKKIILIAEDTFGSNKKKEGHSTTDQLLRDLLIKNGVPAGDIDCYGGYNNTFVQMEKLSSLNKESKPKKDFYVISLDFHKKRVEEVSGRQNIPALHVTAESLLEERYGEKNGWRNKSAVLDWANSPEMLEAAKNEQIKYQPVSHADFLGWIQKLATWAQGSRPPLTTQSHEGFQLPPKYILKKKSK